MPFKFEKLEAWQKAIDFCDKILAYAEKLPQQYQFSLGEQLRRAAISIPTNIAEGCGRDNPKERRSRSLGSGDSWPGSRADPMTTWAPGVAIAIAIGECEVNSREESVAEFEVGVLVGQVEAAFCA